jgi:hypothetical protein
MSTTTVKIAAYRDETQHLFRVANVDYHACVGVREVENWKATAARVLAEADGLLCRRANAYDREQFAKAVAAVRARLLEADTRIAQLQAPREVADKAHRDPNRSEQKTNPTAEEFKQWAIDHKSLAEAACMARAFAELERERVDEYVLPIFNSFNFVDEDGKKIDKPKNLYLCTDEAMFKAYLAQCDAAHRAHGFTGLENQCPALTAENLQLAAERALLEAGCEFLGIEVFRLYGRDQEDRKMLDILLKACLST